MLLDEIRF